MPRRRVLLSASSALLSLSACGDGAIFGAQDGLQSAPPGTAGRAALLAPLSGARRAIGQNMRRAASLGGNDTGPLAEVFVTDAGDTPETAVNAARTAVSEGARMLLGPLFSAQAEAVARAVGRSVPVVSLTNDSAVAGANLFVFGVTPLQSAQAVLRFAALRGKRNIAVVVPPGQFGARSAAAAQQAARTLPLRVADPIVSVDATGLAARLTGTDAVYLPVVHSGFAAQAGAARAAGLQLLGSNQWSTLDPGRIPALRDAWFAAPDPVYFEAFSIAMEKQGGGTPGVVAGLAFDAVEMARALGRIGQQSRKGLLRGAGFDGVLGPYRFTANGRCARALAVLNVAQGATTLLRSASA